MICCGHVNYILSAPFRHVAADAILRECVFSRLHQVIEGLCVALAARRSVVPICFWAARNIMRIVAGGAKQNLLAVWPVALQEACRAPQPVRRVDDLELVFPACLLPARPRSVVEVEDECS